MDRTQVKERRRTATHVARPAKVQEVEGLRQRLGQAAAAILTDFRGLNVREIAQMRAKLRAAGVEDKLVTNALLERAAQGVGVQGLASLLQRPAAGATHRTDTVGSADVRVELIR